VIYFLGLPKEMKVKIQVEEIGDYKWLSYEDAMKLLTYESAKTILKSAKEYLKSLI
jgi:isopentenyldiphosphate isomerase